MYDRIRKELSATFFDEIIFETEMLLHESILCATAPSSSGFGPGAISLHDILTGSSLTSFKQTNASQHCTCFTESRDGNGGFMLAAQPDKAIIHAYNFQKVCYPSPSKFVLHLNPHRTKSLRKSFCPKNYLVSPSILVVNFVLVGPHKGECICGRWVDGLTLVRLLFISDLIDSVWNIIQCMGCPLSTNHRSKIHPRWGSTYIRKRRFCHWRMVHV